MEGFLLSVHVLAGIVFVGGSAVAASLFPRYAPVAAGVAAGITGGTAAGADAAAGPQPAREDERSRAVAVALHRITRVYGILGVTVPVVGIALAIVQGRMGEVWINIAMVLTAVAGALLAFLIYPGQRDALAEPDAGQRLRSLGMLAGVYNLLWAAVVVLMIVRPGAYS
jgi:uncharacterized membrane protein